MSPADGTALRFLIAATDGTVSGTISGMATNLRLRADAERALRERAASTGRSQQELLREAVDRYLGLDGSRVPEGPVAALLVSGRALPPRAAHKELERLVPLPAGMTTETLLARDEQR
jgi:hypothetical protein